MSKTQLYHCLSCVTAFAILCSSMVTLLEPSVHAAPLIREFAALSTQPLDYHVRGIVRNRDGTPLSGVTISLAAYDGRYVGQTPTAAVIKSTAANGEFDWVVSSTRFSNTATIRVEHTTPSKYSFGRVDGLPVNGNLDGHVIQIDNVTPGSVVDVGEFIDKRSDKFEFSGVVMDELTNTPLRGASVQMTYATTTHISGTLGLISDHNGNWAFRERENTSLNHFDVITFTVETLPSLLNYQLYDYPNAQIVPPSIGVVEDKEIHYRGILGGVYNGNQLFLSHARNCLDSEIESEHFKIRTCSEPSHSNYTPLAYTSVLSDALEYTYAQLVPAFTTPALQAGATKVIVNVEHDSFNVCSFQIGTANGIGLPGQIWIKNDLDINPGEGITAPGTWSDPGELTVAAAHELYHLIQWNYLGYDRRADCDDILPGYVNQYSHLYGWWMEANSEWIQYMLHPDNEIYLSWILKVFAVPELPLTLSDGSHEYGTMLFPQYLVERVGNYPDIIRTIWKARAKDSDFIDIIDSQVPGGLAQIFPSFTIANYLYDDPALGYTNGITMAAKRLNVNVAKNNSHELLRINAQDTVAGGRFNPLGASYVEFTPPSRSMRF